MHIISQNGSDSIQAPEIVKPVDTLCFGDVPKDLSDLFSTMTNVFVTKVGNDNVPDILNHYFSELNGGRPFVVLTPEKKLALDVYFAENPQHFDLLVASYVLESADRSELENDLKSRIAEFIGTRTYCLRDRVDEEEE